jgi:hypothetical protein
MSQQARFTSEAPTGAACTVSIGEHMVPPKNQVGAMLITQIWPVDHRL